MLKNKGTCVIEYAHECLRATIVNGTVRHQCISLVPGQEETAAKELASFVEGNTNCRIIALTPRASCVMGMFRLPSRDNDELLSMAKFKFARSSPYRKEDLIVDVKRIEDVSRSQTLIAGAMTVKERLKPFFDILQQAGLNPDVITLNTQRLHPLAKIVWENTLNGEGKVLGLCLNGTLSLGFFARGDLLFSREEGNISDSAMGAFIEYCHQEFPSIAIKEGLFLGTAEETGMARAIAGVAINVQELSTFVKKIKEQSAFEQSPVAYLDLLLAEDGKAGGFDLSPDHAKEERSRQELNRLMVHGIVIAVVCLAGLIIGLVGDWHKKTAVIRAYEYALKKEESHIKDLKDKSRLIESYEKFAAEHVPFSVVMENIVRVMPDGVRLDQISRRNGSLTLRGKAEDLDAAHLFQTGLAQAGCFQNVRLESIDKRPTESAEVVSFRMNMEVRR